ncbi:MAG TPA: histidine ammonia-lyase [Longimicrobiales bacterium]|nr:histidine ammonia-lyase [Longimicrobiales bacterium]
MADERLVLGGGALTLEDVERVAGGSPPEVVLGPEARARVDASRALVERWVAEGRVVYGITTGFGALSDVVIPPERLGELQRNLVRSHSAGVGDPFAERETRAIMLLRANVLALGHSGARSAVIDLLLAMLNAGVLPRIPERGSVGASGDLAPLAHLALTLIGEGRCRWRGGWVESAQALRETGLAPLELEAKEGLALINGTQAMTAVGTLALLAAERALETAEVAGALSLEALRGTPDAFDEAIQRVRPQPGQAESAARLRALLEDSEIRESHRSDDPRVQDAYSLRCMPQVHGAARQGLRYVRDVLAAEVNAATDNPLIFPEDGRILSGGNFHGQPVAQALDLLAIVVADVAAMAERRLARLVDPALSGLPAFLTPDPGVNSGLMMAQIAAAALASEMKQLASPASVDTIPTDANKEDHVSMGVGAALQARAAVRLLETVLALELLTAAQALEFLKPLRPGRRVARAYALVREVVEPLARDRELSPDIERVEARVRAGDFATLWRAEP